MALASRKSVNFTSKMVVAIKITVFKRFLLISKLVLQFK